MIKSTSEVLRTFSVLSFLVNPVLEAALQLLAGICIGGIDEKY